MKEIVLIGGPNGAGKTTAARVLLTRQLTGIPFLNADEIARSIAPENPESAAIDAGRILLEQLHDLVWRGQSFALESTLSGRAFAPVLKACRSAGWRITLYYFWLASPEASIARVANRVREGGHGIPAETIQRRFRKGLWNLLNLYLPLADTAAIYDNSDQKRVLVARREAGRGLEIHDAARWARIEELSR